MFKFFAALFRTYGLHNVDMVMSFLWCFRKGDFEKKMKFLKNGVQTEALKLKVFSKKNDFLFFVQNNN